jgi:biopolymer transport protein ExbD
LNQAQELFLNDQAIDLAALPQALRRMAVQKPQMEVQLRVDQTVPYGQVLELMSMAQQAGLNRIGFVTAPAASPAAAR